MTNNYVIEVLFGC